jgi:hypothetical protein
VACNTRLQFDIVETQTGLFVGQSGIANIDSNVLYSTDTGKVRVRECVCVDLYACHMIRIDRVSLVSSSIAITCTRAMRPRLCCYFSHKVQCMSAC